MSPLADALARMLSIWWLLAAAGIASRDLGSGAMLAAQLAAVAVAGARPAPVAAAPRAAALRVRTTAVARGLLAGGLGYPACQAAIVFLGVAIGLSPVEARAEGVDLATALQRCLLAPLWEEWLYRGRLLPALCPRIGPVAAVGVSSLAFALPHARPWALLGSFVVGCGLGCVWLRLRSPWTGVGIHAGLNAAARLWNGEPLSLAAILASGLACAIHVGRLARGGRCHEAD